MSNPYKHYSEVKGVTKHKLEGPYNKRKTILFW